MEYVTKSGDCWDSIAYEVYGSCKYVEDLINANREHIETFIFSAGVTLKVPQVEKSKSQTKPPWIN